MILLDHRGQPFSTASFTKTKPPMMGDKFGPWAGADTQYLSLPGGTVLQFDLSRLTLGDFRAMRDHYQINASLAVLSFMMHQLDWHIECDDKKLAELIETNLKDKWTELVRALTQAYWSGYSPIVVNWTNGDNNSVIIDKFKDLVPEHCRVNWKKVPGWAPPGREPPKFLHYDGIKHSPRQIFTEGSSHTWPIPPENTLWYPLLMENGDYYGRKLLKPAFPSWFFSNIIHLFANRYYERFGEPVPIGRAPFNDTVEDDSGNEISGKKVMERILTNLRNRSVIVLPNDRHFESKEFEYQIEYMESQMRGADFERYLGRLDEEMSLGLFTPVLLFRTADVGSYNLGQGHMQIFLWMLNSLASDLKSYVQHYLVDRLKDFNARGKSSPRAVIVFREMGKDLPELYKEIVKAMIGAGSLKPDVLELGQAIGMTLEEVKVVTQPPEKPKDPAADKSKPTDKTKARSLVREIAARTAASPDGLSHRRRFIASLVDGGADDDTATDLADEMYSRINRWLPEARQVATDREDLASMVANLLDREIEGM